MTDFNWNDLRAFLAVARTGRLTAAAARLGADHTTVARRIAALEAALGARLFDRSPQGYALTAHGERLMPSAEQVESLTLRAAGQVGAAGRYAHAPALTAEGADDMAAEEARSAKNGHDFAGHSRPLQRCKWWSGSGAA